MMRYARAKGIASMVMSVSVAVLLGMTLPSIGYGQFPPGQKRFIKDGDKLEVKGVISLEMARRSPCGTWRGPIRPSC